MMKMMTGMSVLLLLTALAVCAAVVPYSCAPTSTLGCYQDSQLARVFPVEYDFMSSFMTQESCAAVCSNNDYPLAAVEFGTQCFCGTPEQLSTAVNVPMTDCQAKACPGNKSEHCGSANRMLVYSYSCSGTRLPNNQACVEGFTKSFAFCNQSKTLDERLDDLSSRLNLTDKIAMISPQPALGGTCSDHTAGSTKLGLPQWTWLVETNTNVASACIAPEICATTFNGPLGFGASFNTTSYKLKGVVIGTEIRAFTNLNWHRSATTDIIGITGYGPNINILRDPRFGRSSEVPGEDPFLSGVFGAQMLTGMQEKDSQGHPKMAAYLKHFTAYSRETNRGHDTYNISMHDLWETYLAQYEIAFTQGNPAGAMCSYDAINGHPSCANGYILNKVVRQMWNQTNAHITTDCGAVHNLRGPPISAPSDEAAAAMTINNGTDIEMGSTLFTYSLQSAINDGLTSEEVVEASWRRSYRVHFEAGRFDDINTIDWMKYGINDINSTYHQQIQYEAALQSFVLLKNDNKALPLKSGLKLAVLGPMGVTQAGLLSDYAADHQCWQGTYDCIQPLAQGIANINNAAGGSTSILKAVDVNSTDSSNISAAVTLAQAADVVVLIMGIDKTIEHEAHDRPDTALPGMQPTLITKVLALNKPTILILSNGGALAIDDFMEGPSAIVEVFNPAVKGSVALAATLFGHENRFGKLPYTMYPHDYINQQPMTNYDMSLAPGRTYRYYTGQPLFPFGHGLSYTSFGLTCVNSSSGKQYVHTCTVANTGSMDGDEVVMVYHRAGAAVRKEANHPVPLRSLVAFDRVRVGAGSSVSIDFELTPAMAMLVNEDGVKTLYSGEHEFIVSRGPGLKTDDDVVITLVI
eukprot:m.204769 g.204769  ORF g.204769 m.204769 type:complete len:863 (+) comp17088_c0_seq12:3-2591(+)